MIGNDVIDIGTTRQESNWKRKGFLQKLFTDKECQFILEGDDPEFFVWLIWSAKESAYKIVHRSQQKMFFSPKKFEFIEDHFSNENGITGRIKFEESFFDFKSKVEGDSIHTTAIPSGHLINYISEIFSISRTNYQTQRAGVRTALINWFGGNRDSVQSIEIRKDELGIPYVYESGVKSACLLSLAHHGGYGGFAITFE
ncbi:MAG TPA: 4'-phosphopantetheinyl transferase superfamily protein [Saprospiraceae bacterium]|nr:4'-phosphopantetheinyl transferase superfamily protein [Saprospiraceae bacterium]